MATFIANYGVHLGDLDIEFLYDSERTAKSEIDPKRGTDRVYSVDLNEDIPAQKEKAAALRAALKDGKNLGSDGRPIKDHMADLGIAEVGQPVTKIAE